MGKGQLRALVAILALVVAALLCARSMRGTPQAVGASSGVSAGLPPTETLQLERTRVFAFPAPNGFRGGVQCDARGDAFVQFTVLVGDPMHLAPFPSISEVIPNEKRIVAYITPQLPESKYPHAAVISYGVSPGGKLYALMFARRITSKGNPLSAVKYYVERFKHDGTSGSITPVPAPAGVAHWYADQLVPFPDGGFLVVGEATTAKERPSLGSWGPLTAIYDSTGRFVREVTLPHDVTNNFNERVAGKPRAAGRARAQASRVPQGFEAAISTGGVFSGPDGNVWILRASSPIRLYAVDSAGQVIQHFEISPPAPGLIPFGFGVARPGEIFLDFLRPPPSNPGAASGPSKGPSEFIGVFNSISGQFDALYTLPKVRNAFLGTIACSDGDSGFLYLGSTSGNRLAVFDLAPR